MKLAIRTRSGGRRATVEAASPKPPGFADKAKDLQALRDTVVDAAGISGGLWLSYLFVFFYLAIAAGGVSHRDLFFENPVKLPFLNVDLPLRGFFFLGPLLFLIVHAYTLLHFKFLAGKIVAFDDELEKQIGKNNPDTGGRLRRQLPSNIFVQLLAGPAENRYYLMGFLLRGIAWISLVLGPVLLLIFFQLQFLPFHNVWISWEQRLVVVADLVFLWILWPSVAGRVSSFAKGHVLRGTVWVCLFALTSLLPVLLVFTVATFPGEWLEGANSLAPIGWAHRMVVGGEVNLVTRRPRSLWSNRLVLPGIDVADHGKSETGEKIAALPTTVSLRGRHLEGAVLIGADLRKTDFTGTYLEGALLIAADLREAKFECASTGRIMQCANLRSAMLGGADLRGAALNGAELQGATLEFAHLQGAVLDRAQLQAADLGFVQLEGSSLDGVQLQGASLLGANLEGASLLTAQLQGAMLDTARLGGASLESAELQGVSLRTARLEGALLDRAELQGALLDGAQLQDASLGHVFVWRADAQNINATGARITDPETAPKYQGPSFMLSSGVPNRNVGTDITNPETAPKYEGPDCQSPTLTCKWTAETFAKLKQFIVTAVPQDLRRKETLAQIARLDPDKKFQWQPDAWTRLEQSSPTPRDYDKALADRLWQIGCIAAGGPYVIHGLLNNHFNYRFTGDPSQAVTVALAFLDEAQCPGARGLPEQDKAALQEILDAAATAKP